MSDSVQRMELSKIMKVVGSQNPVYWTFFAVVT